MQEDRYRYLAENPGTYIRFIYHLSDIHINNDSYSDHEYKKIFDAITYTLKKICEHDHSVIIMTGDLIDTKANISAKVLKLLNYFLRNILKIAPIIIIAGNRDCNLNKSDDVLKSVIEMLNILNDENIYTSNGEIYNRIYYLRKSGYYKFHNLVLGYTSLLDTKFIDWDNKNKFNIDNDGIYKIALYHGKVNHSKETDIAIVNKYYNVCDFDGYDYVLLGGNKCFNFLNGQETIAYSGSLIQRGYDEVIGNQGILEWNLEKATHTFHIIEHNYGYLTINIKNGEMIYMHIPKRARIRFNIENTDYETYEKIWDKIRSKYLLCKLEPKLPPFKIKKK